MEASIKATIEKAIAQVLSLIISPPLTSQWRLGFMGIVVII
jgi:hypothetical protein